MNTTVCSDQSDGAKSEHFALVHPRARRAAEVLAAGAINSGRVRRDDRDDLVQDALLHVWRRLNQFDPRRASLPTFVERVVTSSVASTIRKTRAAKRQKADALPVRESLRSFVHEIHLRVDVERVLAQLCPFDRMVAMLLIDHTPSEAAAALELARSKVYRSISRIRAAFGRAWERAG